MRAALVVAAREIVMQRNVLLLAAILATFPFLALLLPATHGYDSNEVRNAVALLLAGGFALVAAAILGATMLTSDAAERRLGFYLARPISATALWIGKIAGVVIVTTAGTLIIGLPALRRVSRAELLGAFGLMIFAIVVAHGIATAIRGGRWRALLDLALLPVAAGAAYAVGLPFEHVRAIVVANVLILPWIAAFVIALVVSGLFQLRFGSWSPAAGHRAWSRAMFSVTFGLALFVDVAYSVYVVSPIPAGNVFWCASMNSDWLALLIASPARLDYVRYGLLNTRTGRRITFWNPTVAIGLDRVFSADQRHAYWTTPGGRLVHVALDDGHLETIDSVTGQILAVSPDGSLVAIDAGETVRVFDITSRKDGATLAVRGRSKGQFLDRDHLRLWTTNGRNLELRDYDAARNVLVRHAPLPLTNEFASIIVSPTAQRLIVEAAGPPLLLDAEGRFLARLTPQGPEWPRAWVFLANDCVIELARGSLWLWSRDGSAIRKLPGERYYGEIAPGILVLGSENHYALYDVDGDSIRWLRGLRPLLSGYGFRGEASSGAAFFLKSGSDVVRLDPRTGRTQTVVHLSTYRWPPYRYWQLRLPLVHRVPYY